MGEWRWPRWFPLYTLIAITLTLTPFWQTCRTRGPVLEFYALDLAQNALLFIPFGLALREYPRALVVALAVLFSGALEIAQTQLPRAPNPVDVLMNAAGAWLGAYWARALPPVPKAWRRAGSFGLAGGSIVALVFALVSASHSLPNDFSNWKRHPLSVGSLPGDPTWRGEMAELALFDRALGPGDRALGFGEPPLWRDDGPILWLRLEAPAEGRGDGPDGATPIEIPDDVVESRGAKGWVLPEAIARAVDSRLVGTGQLTIVARLRKASPAPKERIRIFSMATTPTRHSFAFEQHGADLALRVRTANDRVNVWETELRTRGEADAATLHEVVAAFHGPYARMFVDAECRAEVLFALEYQPWPLARGIALTILICTLAPAASLASRWRAGAGRWIAYTLAGLGAWVLLQQAGVWGSFPDFDRTAFTIACAGLIAAVPLLRERA